MDAPTTALAVSVAKKFDHSLPMGCLHELAQHFRQHPIAWNTIAPTRLERLIADVFRANFAPCEVHHVGKPGDLGIDVVLIETDEKTWLTQVKRRSRPDSTEGFSTLQSLLGSLALHGARHGIVVSTADHFSYQARKQCRRAHESGFVVELGPLLPRHPWMKLLKDPLFPGLDDNVRRQLIAAMPDPAQLLLFD
jgi:hypothetical protein